jgi:hypothetical protein
MRTDDASEWVTSSCADLGLVVASPGELLHNRPWSCAVSYEIREADGTDGRVWFKANGIGTRQEPPLISALGALVPDLVPEVLAIDAERAWSLTRDAGPTWGAAIPVADRWPLWEDLLQRYAAAQLALSAHRAQLLATGIPERSPATLPDQAADLVAELSLVDADSGGLSVAGSQALTARLPAYGQWCRELDGSAIPPTIQHDDLHANNICSPEPLLADRVAGPSGSGRVASAAGADRVARGPEHPAGPAAGARVIDWGDASIGHPFGTMLATLRSIAHHGGCEIDDPRVRRLRDAYLEPFTTYGPASELTALVDIAQRVGAVTRALAWRAALLGTPASVHREHDFPVSGWLEELLTD